MISWKQFCEESTCAELPNPVSHFIFSSKFIQHITEEELAIVHIETLETSSYGSKYVRIWYPKEKYQEHLEKQKNFVEESNKRFPVKKYEEELLEVKSSIVSICCESDIHNYVNKKLDIKITICCKCFKPCKTMIK